MLSFFTLVCLLLAYFGHDRIWALPDPAVAMMQTRMQFACGAQPVPAAKKPFDDCLTDKGLPYRILDVCKPCGKVAGLDFSTYKGIWEFTCLGKGDNPDGTRECIVGQMKKQVPDMDIIALSELAMEKCKECVEDLAPGAKELGGVKKKADDGKKKADDGKKKGNDGKKKADDGKKKADDGKKKADDGKKKTDDGKKKADDGKKKNNNNNNNNNNNDNKKDKKDDKSGDGKNGGKNSPKKGGIFGGKKKAKQNEEKKQQQNKSPAKKRQTQSPRE